MAYTTIDLPTDYFNTKLYTGNNTTDTAITGIGFQPDWVWVKRRSSTQFHGLYDSVRGATKQLASNIDNAEDTNSESLKSFDSDGFTIGTSPRLNASSETYVSWNWLAGGTASSNTDGDITSSVSANTTVGFSIVSFTGNGSADQQVGHGLGTTPTCYITKDRTNGSTNWHYHTTQIDGGMDFAKLNLTDAFSSSSLSAPSSTTIRVGGTINTSSANFISYVFAEKKGYSKFGSYVGNANTDGPFVYTGFRPAWIMVKATDAAKSWYMWDNKRSTSGSNVVDDQLLADTNDSEFDGSNIDMLSNGFKFRGSGSGENGSGTNYIYMAFAESPFVSSSGVPTVAR